MIALATPREYHVTMLTGRTPQRSLATLIGALALMVTSVEAQNDGVIESPNGWRWETPATTPSTQTTSGNAFTTGDSAPSLLKQAQDEASAQNHHVARSMFDQAIQHPNASVNAFIAYQYYLFSQGDNAGTVHIADRAKEAGIEHPYLSLLKGYGHLQMNEYGRAIGTLSALIAAHPDYVEAHIYRGNAYRKSGQPDTALADLNAAIDLSPGNLEALRQRAVVHHNAMNHVAAAADYRAIIDQEPEDSDIWMKQGLSQLQLEKYTRALTSFETVLAIEPDNDEAMARRGDAFRHLNQLDGAARAYKEALLANPENATALNGQLILFGNNVVRVP